VIVPPIGIVLILDQLILPRFSLGSHATSTPSAALRWEPFASWGTGSAAAFLAHTFAPWLSDAVVGMVVAAGVYTASCAASRVRCAIITAAATSREAISPMGPLAHHAGNVPARRRARHLRADPRSRHG
jgi:hypothetical protein